ncbi:type I restriction-modification system subunit M [Alcanivorax sp. S6407]|uniref:class I SAM-dependent DNA methyltransferase n=1 Tax=Alcanivorax sp. S6407 TaxID=2926424 RepID=UPI001FF4166D|nr:N-6 DNA methylase [Alcanivorax sp. S6407]MCK0154613.1 type I restriction-modification system subunit M [Alcanivorax sp. S6407]
MHQLQHIEAIEKRLWKAADTLRSNSELASNEYFMPVMGLIFLRHAYSRFLKVRAEIEKTLPSRGGKTRALTKEDFSQKGSIFLQEHAQFDHLVALSDADDRAEAIIEAMESIEKDYTGLQGQLPKQEFRDIPNQVLGQLLRTLNPDELKQTDGDIFGRIYEYFLTQFADQGAHDGGEFFTPISLVQLIVNVIEPRKGKILDPACGSGGMFVQSAHFVEELEKNPGTELTFYGHEKNKTTTRLAKMNLRTHGLEGNIAGGNEAITYYNDPHEGLWGNCDFVMANPPFNVDEVDAEKVENDRRLPFGLPSVNKGGKVSNGNYLWISYFYSYLNNTGRAGFVMSSQASSAGGGEAKVRKALVETGDVDAMIDIRGNFFYTRSVPCQLWFLNKNKPKQHKDKVLMLDARNVYRKVTRKIYDFSPEQLANLTSIVWLYRGEQGRFIELVQSHITNAIDHAWYAFSIVEDEGGKEVEYTPINDFLEIMGSIEKAVAPFYGGQAEEYKAQLDEFSSALKLLSTDTEAFDSQVEKTEKDWSKGNYDKPAPLLKLVDKGGMIEQIAETCRDTIKQVDLVYKLATRLIETAEKELEAKASEAWDARLISSGKDSLRKQAESAREEVVEELKQARYFYKQAHWLMVRFPKAELVDVEGLVKLVNIKEIEANDWSLTPGRYVGVAPEEEDEDFDFEDTLRDIHVELQGLNEEAAQLADKIAQNFKELGV